MLVVTPISTALHRLELGKFLFPVAQHMGFDATQLTDLTDREVALCGNWRQLRFTAAAVAEVAAAFLEARASLAWLAASVALVVAVDAEPAAAVAELDAAVSELDAELAELDALVAEVAASCALVVAMPACSVTSETMESSVESPAPPVPLNIAMLFPDNKCKR